jgi:hypothetical protein
LCAARAALQGAAITHCGNRHSIHRMRTFVRGQIVFEAWDKTGKSAG